MGPKVLKTQILVECKLNVSNMLLCPTYYCVKHVIVSNMLLCQTHYCIKQVLAAYLFVLFCCQHAAVVSCCACEAPQLCNCNFGAYFISLSCKHVYFADIGHKFQCLMVVKDSRLCVHSVLPPCQTLPISNWYSRTIQSECCQSCEHVSMNS